MSARLSVVALCLAVGCVPWARIDGNADGGPADTGPRTDLGDTAVDRPADVGAVDVQGDVPADVPRRRCDRDDQCTASDFCINAQVCRMGFCEETHARANCDDGIECTVDTCNTTRGGCDHVATSSMCTGGQMCVVDCPSGGGACTGGCVAPVQCSASDDSACASMGGDICTGAWRCNTTRNQCERAPAFDCDDMDPCTVDRCTASAAGDGGVGDAGARICGHEGPDYQTDARNCGMCGRACSAGMVCTAGACMVDCRTNPDEPDLTGMDTNCDGVDGIAARAIFVREGGNDAAPGTRAEPKRTIAAAITAAQAAGVGFAVYIAAGTYAETITLASGVSLYGGYNGSDWTRAAGNVTTIQGGTTAVVANELAGATVLQRLTIVSAAATTPGESSYGVRARGGSSRLTLQACTITAGAGAVGVAGTDGVMGATGANGGMGGVATSSNGAAGTAGTSACAGAGGGGGAGRFGQAAGVSGNAGMMVTGGGAGGAAGGGGGAGLCVAGVVTNGGSAAPASAAAAGSPGGNGANGTAGSNVGSFATDTGLYVPPGGGVGTPGRAGGGGGGGGSGGGGSIPCGTLMCCGTGSGGGGGGGAGGCGGTAGGGGGGGGGSFAVLSVGAMVTIDGGSLTAGAGGVGGRGGNGGGAGAPGSGGGGGMGASNSGNGGNGAIGGRGGPGGSGAGGAGGPSVCVLYVGTAPTLNMPRYARSTTPAAGGAGGTSVALGAAPVGPVGLTEDVRLGM